MGHAQLATAQMRGFDCNQRVTESQARAFASHGYSFALRYVRRDPKALSDLSTAEIAALHAAGLAVSVVQHFGPHEGWEPSDELGKLYGANAAHACTEIGLPAGVTVWLDLEGVASHVGAETVIRYANRWHDVVKAAGFEPGIYVGWGNGMTGDQLYRRIRFARYFAAYNLNKDMEPAVRGVCMKQHAALSADHPPGLNFPIDVDIVRADALGGLPTFYCP